MEDISPPVGLFFRQTSPSIGISYLRTGLQLCTNNVVRECTVNVHSLHET